jgi:hypothetical protein
MTQGTSLVNAKALRIDDASATVTYFGYAVPGTTDDAAAWGIKRMTVVGTETLIEYANGNTDLNSVWNNRASLSYS